MKHITLEEIIRRKIAYIQNNPDTELQDVDAGYIRGFSEMLADINLCEADFIAKYSEKIKRHNAQIDSVFEGDLGIPDFGAVSGYTNAVVEILSLLDTKYMLQ